MLDIASCTKEEKLLQCYTFYLTAKLNFDLNGELTWIQIYYIILYPDIFCLVVIVASATFVDIIMHVVPQKWFIKDNCCDFVILSEKYPDFAFVL